MSVDTALTHPGATRTPIGELLRAWRRRRSLSQLELALEADVSSRHVSFLETGRARPSREMVLRPLRAHEPYPAGILDRHYNLVSANDAVAVLTEGIAPELVEPPANALRATLRPRGMAPRILNLPEWSAHLLQRLRRRVAITGDPELEQLYDELSSYPHVSLEAPHDERTVNEIVLPLRMRDGERELAFFSTVSTFGTAVEITLAELMIEAFYRANAATAAHLLKRIAGPWPSERWPTERPIQRDRGARSQPG